MTKTPLIEKVLRIAFLGGLIFGAVKLYNWLAPVLIEAAVNTAKLLMIGVPIAFIVLMGILNYKVLWMWFLGFCKKITSWIVKMDPLSIMDGYLAILRKKYSNLEDTRLVIEGKKTQLERTITEKKEQIEKFNRLAIAAGKQSEHDVAKLNAIKAKEVSKTVAIYTPMYEKYTKSSEFLGKLSQNWKMSIDTLSFTIENKREEFMYLKEIVKGLKGIDDYMNSDSLEAQLFAQSIKALEEDVSHKIAYIEDFEKKAKPILTNMKVSKQADDDEAVQYLEDLMRNSELNMPNYQTQILQPQAVTINADGNSQYKF